MHLFLKRSAIFARRALLAVLVLPLLPAFAPHAFQIANFQHLVTTPLSTGQQSHSSRYP